MYTVCITYVISERNLFCLIAASLFSEASLNKLQLFPGWSCLTDKGIQRDPLHGRRAGGRRCRLLCRGGGWYDRCRYSLGRRLHIFFLNIVIVLILGLVLELVLKIRVLLVHIVVVLLSSVLFIPGLDSIGTVVPAVGARTADVLYPAEDVYPAGQEHAEALEAHGAAPAVLGEEENLNFILK